MTRVSALLFLTLSLPISVFANRGPLDTLSRIVVPEIRFDSARVEDVVTMLVRTSREQDPRGIGVNMILVTSSTDHADAPPLPTITLELREVTLLQVLDLVTERAGLRYRVDRNIVMIERRGTQRMETRFYSVDPSLFTERTRILQR